MVRRLFKQKTLIRNIERIIDRAQKEDLPARIREVYAFGGILRGREVAHDFDAVFLYDQTPEQGLRWEKLRNTLIDREFLEELSKCYPSELELGEVISAEPMISVLKEKGADLRWAVCFSWTDIFSSLGTPMVTIEKVLRSMLTGGMRGIQAVFRSYEDFKRGETMLLPKNFKLAWSPEKPSINNNLMMSPEEEKSFLASELSLFIQDLEKQREELAKVISNAQTRAREQGIDLDFEELLSVHRRMTFDESYGPEELREKCELARSEMRAFREEIATVETLAFKLENLRESAAELKRDPKSLLAFWTILRTRKREVKEERIREILRLLGLPENQVITLRYYGGTSYHLPSNEAKRIELLERARQESLRLPYLKQLSPLARSFNRNMYVDVKLENEKPTKMTISYCKWFIREEPVDEALLKRFQQAGFSVETSTSHLSADKEIVLRGEESLKELGNTIAEILRRIFK